MGLVSNDDSSSSVADLRLVLLGKTGSGKSASGNTILEREAFVSDNSPSSVTKTCKKETCHFDDRTVRVVDTPGIFDTSAPEDNWKSEIVKCLTLSDPGPHVFLLVIRVGVRFTEEEQNAIKWIKANFGEEFSKYMLVLFTRGDELKESIENYLKKSPELVELIRSSTTRYVVFDNTRRENRTQVADLFEKIDEIVLLNDSHYTKDMYDEAQKKLKSKQWWTKWGNVMNNIGNNLLTGAALAAAPAAPAALAAEEVAVSVGAYAMAGAGAALKGIGRWVTPKKKEG